MRYFFYVLLFCSYVCCLQKSSSKRYLVASASTHSRYAQEQTLSDADKNSRQIQFDDLCTALLKDLEAYAQPEEIQKHLDRWDSIKTLEINMGTDQTDRILITARSMTELALAQNSELQSSKKVQFNCNSTANFTAATKKYINAQLNYDKICNHLGIKKSS